jgi:hypothetical protein
VGSECQRSEREICRAGPECQRRGEIGGIPVRGMGVVGLG